MKPEDIEVNEPIILNQTQMKRAKLFELSDEVQAVAIKQTNEEENPEISIKFLREKEGVFIDFQINMEYKTVKERESIFKELQSEPLVNMYNTIIKNSGLPSELIINKI